MSKLGKLSFRPSKLHLLLLLVLLLFAASSCQSDRNNNKQCYPSSCGDVQNISQPFRLKGVPQNCGSLELSCENNHTVVELNSKTYYVKEIDYERFQIRVVDPGIQEGNFSSFPVNSLEIDDIESSPYVVDPLNTQVVFVRCKAPPKSSKYVDTTKFTNPFPFDNSYALVGDSLKVADVEDSCHVNKVSWMAHDFQITNDSSFPNVHYGLANGFLLLWPYYIPETCKTCEYRCIPRLYGIHRKFKCLYQIIYGILYGITDLILYQIINPISYRYLSDHPYATLFGLTVIVIGLCLAARFLLGIPLLLALIIYKKRRWHLSMFENIEDFLQGPNNLAPVRYTYSDLRKMTDNLSDKLGEGGFGSVFKGKLRSGPFAAVKMLDKTRASGQEFISEVATIGRIHHINVVKLIGFCVERSKYALVYEFMPNGSLEKYIFSQDRNTISLSCEKMFEIALGVARGIDYLHRGCDVQILHFDIKPHNILLDENFTPKISDFGLAKLYPTEDSIVSLTAARGTLGYMAPELFYKNIGGVSYKADVYSFGMLLLEMTGKRKNLDSFAEHRSQIYFPSWIYDQLHEGKDIKMSAASEDEKKMVKKMMLVALWCIQMKPTDRPSMSKVIEMLEGDLELLEMPPRPFQSQLEMLDEDEGADADATELPLLSADSINSSHEDASQTLSRTSKISTQDI